MTSMWITLLAIWVGLVVVYVLVRKRRRPTRRPSSGPRTPQPRTDPPPPRVEQAIERQMEILRPHRRETTVLQPRVLDEDEVLPPRASRLGGVPYAEAGDTWPMCGCGRPLAFVGQLDPADAPSHPVPDFGLFTLFMCFACPLDDVLAKDEGCALRCYATPSADRAVAITPSVGEYWGDPQISLTPCALVPSQGYTVPHWEEPFVETLPEDPKVEDWFPWGDGVRERACARLGADAMWQTQVGGWPYWVHGPRWPETADGRRFVLLMQVNSEVEVGLVWGDVGTAYFFVHPDDTNDIRIYFDYT